MRTLELVVPPEAEGQRLDAWTAAASGELSRSAVQALTEQGSVLCDGRPANKKDRLRPGQTITVLMPDPQAIEARPQDLPLESLY